MGALWLALAAAAPLFAPAQGSGMLAVRAAKLHVGDGRVIDNGVLLVEGGVIRAVGAGVPVPGDAELVEHDGHVTAGMIATHTYSGIEGEASDPTRAVLPEARVVYAFDPERKAYDEALRAGITSVVLTPRPDNVVGGLSAVVKTAGGRVLAPRAHLCLSLGSEAQQPNREPTSAMGVLAELEQRFADGKGGEGPFAEAAAKRLPVLIYASARHEIQRAAELAQRFGLTGALVSAPLAGELAPVVAASGLGVIVGPIDEGADGRVLRSAAALAAAGVPLAFGLDAPAYAPESLRLFAAQCVREGLSPIMAWKALSSDGARIAGVGDRIGSLAKGLDADFVLWSGNPLDLGSQVIAVYVDGQRADLDGQEGQR
jgi:imidazolonepropionase-like amidohydrolase